jgi:SAM-dependent methyltransferase
VSGPEDTAADDQRDQQYADRLVALGDVWWKRLLGAQLPYRWNLRRLQTGFTLDIGCGTGRNLEHLAGHGVGVDPNAAGVSVARSKGWDAFSPDAFQESPYARPETFDSLLFAHVLEHLGAEPALELVRRYLPYLRHPGTVILITPQESGFRSDDTHVEFLDFAKLLDLVRACGLAPTRQYSFPLPRPLGRLFRYNEFVVVATST